MLLEAHSDFLSSLINHSREKVLQTQKSGDIAHLSLSNLRLPPQREVFTHHTVCNQIGVTNKSVNGYPSWNQDIVLQLSGSIKPTRRR